MSAPVIAYMNNRSCLLDREYLRIEGDKIIASHSPFVATVFASSDEAEATLEAIFYRAEDVHLISDIESEKNAFNAFLNGKMPYRKFDMLHPLSRPYMGEDKTEVFERACAVVSLSESQICCEHEQTWPKLYSLFESIQDAILISDDTGEESGLSFVLTIKSTTSFSQFQSEWDMIINKITSIDSQGNKIIDVLEHTLSEFESVYALYNEKNSTYSIGTQYSQVVCPNFESFFNHWKLHYPFD